MGLGVRGSRDKGEEKWKEDNSSPFQPPTNEHFSQPIINPIREF